MLSLKKKKKTKDSITFFNDKWKEVEQITDYYAFNDIAYLIGEDGMLEEKIDWSELYGELENGEYRLVKELYINGYNYFSVEFTIE